MDLADIRSAAQRIGGYVRETPVLPAGELSRRLNAPVLLKAENLQRTGSFKVRGASNRIALLSDEQRARGVVAASAGNHAQGVAFAAARLGARATVVMPATAPLAKVAAARQYGARVLQVDGGYEEACRRADELVEGEGQTLVPAFDDPHVVAGQGTVGLEIAAAVPDLRLVVVPLGGGGLISGVAIAVKSLLPGVRVVGVQSEDRSTSTICDGIAVKSPGDLTGPLVESWVDELVTVTDDEAAEAMVLLLERSKLVVEGAGAVGVAALMRGKVDPPGEGSVCAVLSGGNVDASLLVECIRMGETSAGRRIVMVVVLPDRPGSLANLLQVIADRRANVVTVEHIREGMHLHLRETAVQLVLQTNGPEHDAEIMEALRSEGFGPRLEY